jgi:hypothetical protein
MLHATSRGSVLSALVAVGLLLSACEKTSTQNITRGSAAPLDLGPSATASVNPYQFMAVDKQLEEARVSAQQANWREARLAAESILKQQPDNAEAQDILARAKVEEPHFAKYEEMMKAAGSRQAALAVKHFRAIPETSTVHARAKTDLEAFRKAYVDESVVAARDLLRDKRCPELRRMANNVGEAFPEQRSQIDPISIQCLQTTGRQNEVASVQEEARKPPVVERKPDTTTASVVSNPTATASSELPGTIKGPDAEKPATELAAIPPVPVATTVSQPVVPKPVLQPVNVQVSQIESLRLGGVPKPALSPSLRQAMQSSGTKMAIVAAKMCFSDKGSQTLIQILKGSDLPELNSFVKAELAKWRFKPYMQSGVATPTCTSVVLQYTLG